MVSVSGGIEGVVGIERVRMVRADRGKITSVEERGSFYWAVLMVISRIAF